MRQLIGQHTGPDTGWISIKLPKVTGELCDENKHFPFLFQGFNRELEEICRTQKAYAIPDENLRDEIKSENKARVVNQYKAFRERFLKTNFTRNAEKYIKYTAHDVADMLDKMFDVTS